jgi:flagellar protein FlbD
MIFVTRLDGHQMLVNQDLIAMAEATPDTLLTFTTGSKLMVKEKLGDIAQRVVEYEREARAGGVPGVSHG